MATVRPTLCWAAAARQQAACYGTSSLAAAAAGAAVAAAADLNDLESDNGRAFAIAMARVCDDTKASDITLLDVRDLCSWTSFMLLCTVCSKPQLVAVLARVEEAAAADWGRSKQNNGTVGSQWEAMDFGDVLLHVFDEAQREFYDLDGFWAAAEEVPLPYLAAQDAAWRSAGAGASGGGAAAASSGGPMWSTRV